MPFPPGGLVDTLARAVTQRMTAQLGQPVVVENKPGASGNIGIDAVAKSPPDGYTIGGATVGHFSINQFLIAKMPYDAEKDLIAPSLAYELPNVAVVAANHVQAKTLQEFIAFAKARPNGISIGSPGPGTTPHLSGVLFAARTGVNAIHVPFRGAAQTIPAMLAGDVTFAVDNLASYIPQIEAGTMRALAVTSLKRSPALPGVPALSEILPGFAVTGWYGIIAPAGTPRDIVDKIRNDVAQVLADPKVRDNLAGDGAIPVASTPDEFRGFIAAETEKWAAVIKTAGVTPP